MSELWRLTSEPVGPPIRSIDLVAIRTEGTDQRSLRQEGPYQSTRPLVFRAACKPSELTDFPFTTNGWPIYSARAAAVFGEDAVTFPITVQLPDGTEDTTGFVLCTARGLTDGLNLDACQTVPNRFNPGSAPRVVAAVVQADRTWPRLVRLRRYATRVFVSEDARQGLVKRGMRGARFWSVPSA